MSQTRPHSLTDPSPCTLVCAHTYPQELLGSIIDRGAELAQEVNRPNAPRMQGCQLNQQQRTKEQHLMEWMVLKMSRRLRSERLLQLLRSRDSRGAPCTRACAPRAIALASVGMCTREGCTLTLLARLNAFTMPCSAVAETPGTIAQTTPPDIATCTFGGTMCHFH